MSIINLTPAQLRKAADLQDKIAQLQSELTAIFGSESKAAPKAARPAKKKGGMSAAGRAKVAAAQKARWAKINAAKGKTVAEKVIQAVKTAAKPAKKKPTISAAGIARIKAAQKARWAKVKAAKPAAKVVVDSKTAPIVKPAVIKPAKKKFTMSAAAKAKISAAAKARWAAKKAGQAKK